MLFITLVGPQAYDYAGATSCRGDRSVLERSFAGNDEMKFCLFS